MSDWMYEMLKLLLAAIHNFLRMLVYQQVLPGSLRASSPHTKWRLYWRCMGPSLLSLNNGINFALVSDCLCWQISWRLLKSTAHKESHISLHWRSFIIYHFNLWVYSMKRLFKRLLEISFNIANPGHYNFLPEITCFCA